MSVTPQPSKSARIAVVIPCLNEAEAIETVIRDARTYVPQATIVVGDNMSTDATAAVAAQAGAQIQRVQTPGKGNVVRRLLADVEADIYVMVDGDATYSLDNLAAMLQLVHNDGVDMVVGKRIEGPMRHHAYRSGHRLGNRFLTWIFSSLFRLPLTDTLSGLRVMSRRFVKSLPTSARGFEIETDLNVHASALGCSVIEVPCAYSERLPGSNSKLRTYRDGVRILQRNLLLFRDARPVLAFSILAAPWLMASGILVGIPLVEYLDTGVVLRFPSLIAGIGTFLLGVLLVQAGLLLARTAQVRREAVTLAYLAIPRWSNDQ